MTHCSRFRIAVWDVNPFDELSALSSLRFMQQAASDASAALGYDVEWYAQQGAVWLIRDTTLEVLEPARYRDEIEVRTWVEDIRRVRSLRRYEFVRCGDGQTVARGLTDWVYTDVARGRPSQPPEDLQHALMPDGVVVSAREPMKFDAPDGAATARRHVEFADLDTVGHVNNSVYVTYVEQALFDACGAAGWTLDALGRDGHLRAVRHRIEYHESAEYADDLTSRIWVVTLDEQECAVRQVLESRGVRLVSAESRWRWSGERLPDSLRTALQSLRR